MAEGHTVSINQAIDDFLEQLSVGKQPNTVKAYGVTLRRLARFLAKEESIPPEASSQRLTVEHVIAFSKSLQKLAPATVRNYLAAISQFYRYLFANRLIPADIADHERLYATLKQMRPRSSTLPHVPPDDVVDALVQAAGEETVADRRLKTDGDRERSRLRRLRDVALLLALKSSGMRLGEALALKRGDLDYRNHSTIVTGKGRKQRVVYFDAAAWSAIQVYLQERHDGSRSRALAQNPVFASHGRGTTKMLKPLTHQRVEQIFAELAARSRLDPPPTPHWLRHWFATRVLDRTQDLAAVQDLLGHASPVTTRIYAKVSSKRLRQVHDATFGGEKRDEK